MRLLSVLFLSSILSVSGCAAANRQVQPSYKVVAASAESQPYWVSTKASEDARYVFFVGRADGAADLSVGENQAEAQVRTVIRGAIHDQLRREFEAGHGTSLADKREVLDRALMTSLSELALNDHTPVARYWERLEVPVNDGTRYSYRLALLVRIPKDRFEATRAQAYRKVASQIGL